MVEKLLKEEDGKLYVKRMKLLDEGELKSLGPQTVEVLKEVAKERSYPKDLSKKLDMHEQKVYYHIGKLRDAGLVEVYDKRMVGGAQCKFYRPTSEAFGFQLTDDWRRAKMESFDAPEEVLNFFSEFVDGGTFNGSVVVGSPKQHGPFMTSARDGHYAVQLGIFLGNFCSLENRYVVKLDTEVKAEDAVDRHLMLIGGPITNTVSMDLNEDLEVKFDWERTWKIVSGRTGNAYREENIGIVAKVREGDRVRVLLSGLDHKGTKSCIIGVTQQHEKVLEGFEPGEDFYRVIKGLDLDGDGKTDDIEVLE